MELNEPQAKNKGLKGFHITSIYCYDAQKKSLFPQLDHGLHQK